MHLSQNTAIGVSLGFAPWRKMPKNDGIAIMTPNGIGA